MRSFNQHKRHRSRDRAIDVFEQAFREVNSAAHCSNSSNQAAVAAAANLGGECNPASGTEGQSEIGAAVAAAPSDTVGFGTALSDSSSDLGGGECAPSATGTGLSEIGAVVAAASHDSAAVTAPSGDSATAAAASQDGAVAAAALHDSAVLAADTGAPATRAAADRLQPPSTVVGWTTVDDITRKFFHLMFVYTKSTNKHLQLH